MPGMMDLLFLKSGAAGAENEGERAYLLMLEKASIEDVPKITLQYCLKMIECAQYGFIYCVCAAMMGNICDRI